MSTADHCQAPLRTPKPRKDGWTIERQLRFLDALRRTRCITRAAAHVGMSRETAYRLRKRAGAALFAAAWDEAMKVTPVSTSLTPARASQLAEYFRLFARSVATAPCRERASGHQLRDLGAPSSTRAR